MAAKPMGYTRGLWLLLMLVWVCAEEDPLPDKYTGTWVGTAGSSELNIAIHGGLRKSVVGVVTDKFSYTVCQYELVYDTEESDAGVLGMVSGEDLLQEGCKNMTYSLQTVGKEKLLVDMQVVEKKEGTIEKGPMVSLVLIRRDDGKAAEGRCILTPTQKLEAALAKKKKSSERKTKKGL